MTALSAPTRGAGRRRGPAAGVVRGRGARGTLRRALIDHHDDVGAERRPSTPTATATETEEPVPFPADVSVDEQSPSDDAQLTVTDVTTGQHEGYDRVVFRLDGTGTPGWMVRYTEGATDDPADTELDIAGDGTLQVILLGFQLPYVTGIEEWGGDPILTPDYTVLREVNVRGQFEGQELAYLGLDAADHPFRVFALTDPTRVVVDVRHDS